MKQFYYYINSHKLTLQLLVVAIVFLLLAINSSFGSYYTIISPSGSRINIYTQKINDVEYISISSIAKNVFQNSKYSTYKGEIIFGESLIKCAPSGFFIAYETETELKIAQMILPALTINNDIYVPIESYFYCLGSLGLFNVHINNNVVTLSIPDIIREKSAESEKTISKKENVIVPKTEKVKYFIITTPVQEAFRGPAEYILSGLSSLNKLSGYYSPEQVKSSSSTKSRFRPPRESATRPETKKPDVKNTQNSTIKQADSQKNDRKEETTKLQFDTTQNITPSYPVQSNTDIKSSEQGAVETVHTKSSVSNESINEEESDKDNVKPDNQYYPPNLYVIPQHLIRKELDQRKSGKKKDKNKDLNFHIRSRAIENIQSEIGDTLELRNLTDSSKQRLSDGVINKGYNLYASNSLLAMVSATRITDIYAVKKKNCTEIHVVADKTIESYQRPEYEKGSLTIRIPDVVNDVNDFSKVESIEPIISVRHETIRNFLIYRMKINSELNKWESQRNGSNEIIYYLYYTDKEIGNDLEIVTPENKPNTPIVEEQEEPTENAPITNISALENEKKKWELDVIVLDPGHGGEDVGAVSIGGLYEKDLTLSIAKELRELINENMPDTKVVMTREDDRFIELYRRGHIANENEGKLFISIHINAAAKKPHSANGIETYILRPGRNDDAIRVANLENSVIKFEKEQEKYKKLTEEEIIISTMAQSAFVKFSELFARIVQEDVVKSTGLADRGVKQAGFYVLVGASMPNVLFEAGFLSNYGDEKFIGSLSGQKKIAKGLYEAIEKYAKEYMRGSK